MGSEFKRCKKVLASSVAFAGLVLLGEAGLCDCVCSSGSVAAPLLDIFSFSFTTTLLSGSPYPKPSTGLNSLAGHLANVLGSADSMSVAEYLMSQGSEHLPLIVN